MVRKFLSVLMLLLLSASVSYAYTPTYPLANITAYQFFKNMGYEVSFGNPSAMTPDGYPIYSKNLPEDSLVPPSRGRGNILIITDKSGANILGVKLFFKMPINFSEETNLIANVFKALNENAYNTMTPTWFKKQIREFVEKIQPNQQFTTSLTSNSLDRNYRFIEVPSRDNSIINFTIEAYAK